jgi:hypothetical protein
MRSSDLPDLIKELNNPIDSARFKAIEKLKIRNPSKKEQIYLLNEAVKSYPPAEYDWQSIPGILVELATKTNNIDIIQVIKNNYDQYDSFAKNEALRFLSNYDDLKSITLFKELALKYPSGITYLPMGILNKNFKYKDIIFPDLLDLTDQESTDSEVLLLFLDYLNSNQLNSHDFLTFKTKFVSLSEKYREIIKNLEKTDIDIWDDGDYQNARFKAGIIADLLGYFNDENVKSELENYLSLTDNKLVMFASISLLKMGDEIKPELIERIAADSECRQWLFNNLISLKKLDLFPEKYKTQEALAESDMVNWLIYPTELARKPDSIQLMKIIEVDSKSKDGIVEFYLFRFKSNHEPWLNDGWLTGVSGYFRKKDKPTTSSYGYTFSSFEKWDSKTPDEHLHDIQDLINESYKKK